MPVFSVNGIQTTVETRGDAARPALLLLHGGVTGNLGLHYWELHNIADRLAEDFFVVTYIINKTNRLRVNLSDDIRKRRTHLRNRWGTMPKSAF